MAWELLRTDYVDATFEGLRRYLMSENGDGSVSFHDITNYTVKEGSFFGAKDANKINTAVNAILAALENGTDLYEVFIQFFELQKTLFLKESDAKQEGFEAYITQLRSYMDGKWDELKSEYTGDIQYFKDVQENAFNVWFQMVRDQLTNDVAGHLQTQIGNLDLLETEDKESLVNAANDLQAQIEYLDNLNTTAHNNLISAINEAKAASGVTGVKGNKESSYRKGNVNITPENIGALPDETVPVSKGGTGQNTAAAAINALANAAAEGNSTPSDNDWYLCQYAGGGTANTSVIRRKMSALWNWIKPKVDALLTAKVSKTGDTMKGSLNFASGVWNNFGNNVAIATGNSSFEGTLGIKGLNGMTRLRFFNHTNETFYKDIFYNNANNMLVLQGRSFSTIEFESMSQLYFEYGTTVTDPLDHYDCVGYIAIEEAGTTKNTAGSNIYTAHRVMYYPVQRNTTVGYGTVGINLGQNNSNFASWVTVSIANSEDDSSNPHITYKAKSATVHGRVSLYRLTGNLAK